MGLTSTSADAYVPIGAAADAVVRTPPRAASRAASRRILHVIPSVSAQRGGVCAAIWTTLQALRLRGIAADLVTTDDDGAHSRFDVPHGKFIRTNDTRVCYFPRQAIGYTFSAPLFSWMLRHARDYDLIHTHGLFTFVPLAASFAARIRGVPYVMCPHGTLTRWARNDNRARVKHTSLRFVEKPLLAGAARVHFTSQSEMSDLREIAPNVNGAVIPFGLDLQENLDARVAQLQHVASENARPTVLFLSRIHPVKGLDLLLTAFAKVREACPDALLVIAGDGPAELTKSLRDQAHQLGIETDVRWVGFVSGEAKNGLLATSSVFVLPSWSENFSYAVVEAMSARMPVVVTRAVGVSDLVDRAGAGFVIEHSVDSLVTAMVALLRNPSLRRRMGEAGCSAVARELSLETFGARLESMYDEVLERRGADVR
jgi:glycosyltransferase involved in cell wall biosynthesis